MKKLFTFLISILLGGFSYAQITNNYQSEFEMAYNTYPEIPLGILEGVAYAQTRITNISGNNESCTGLPQVSGPMGLTEDGEGYFKDNLAFLSDLTSVSIQEIKTNPSSNILVYATGYSYYMNELSINSDDFEAQKLVLSLLSEIPIDHNPVNSFALSCFVYEVYTFLDNPEFQQIFSFPDYQLDFVQIFGQENLNLLRAENLFLGDNGVYDEAGNKFLIEERTTEYGPALWVPTPTCNYSSRAGTPISAVTVHTIQGSYAGAISWAQNCSANVSYHYVARSSDGQITQMVYEADKGWHVGSENPYCIGIEHEGYVDNPAWYTDAMYIGSAALVKDITQSGYGISPLRTFQGPATTGTNLLGGCIRIKGHQHFQNQTHTDPGINWDWEYYYQLINENPPIASYTAATGTIYDTGGGAGNYSDDERELYLIEPSGVATVTLTFPTFNLENNWDYLYVYDGNSISSSLIGAYTGTSIPSSITATGGSILVEFRSDCNTTTEGYEIHWTSVPPAPADIIPPSTTVDVGNIWHVADFDANFTDDDNVGGSGIDYQFYQVIDFDGVEWRANSDNGFFSDNFDAALHADWSIGNGNWSINATYLNQDDEADGNTNIYTSMNQDDNDVFLYHYAGKISGSGTNKRAGFHFMCDDPTLPNRGNSYFVWFRADDNKIQIYKVVADVFTLEEEVVYTINENQWYDIKTVYDKNSGEIQVWVDNTIEASWTDPSPLTSGNSVSFRSGNSIYEVNNLKIYHERSLNQVVTIGPAGDIRYENQNPLSPSGKIKSITIDSAANISSIAFDYANVDWTIPLDISYINDGTGSDINVTTTNTELSANWSATIDPNSDIEKYWYSIGTSPGSVDIVNWTDNWYDTTITHTGLSLAYGTTYFFNVRAEDGAGLISNIISTDGQLLQVPTGPPTANFSVLNTNICNSDSIQFLNSSTDASTYEWQVPGAMPAISTDINPYFQFPASGTYEVTLIATGGGGVDTTIQFVTVESFGTPVSAFSPSDLIVDITNPIISFTNSSTNANGYYWDFGDGNSTNDFQPWYEYADTGTYVVMLIAINGTCPNDTSYVTVQVVGNLAIEETNHDAFSVFPNPSNGLVTLTWDSSWFGEEVLIELVDSRGRLVWNTTRVVSPQMILFENEEFEKGVYFIRVNTDKGSLLTKLIFN